MNHPSPGSFDEALILVLMPVYNGEKFLREQMDSILQQSHGALRLICRDDGSTDSSLQILRDYVSLHPARVQLLEDNQGNLGAAGSFSQLMQWALNFAEVHAAKVLDETSSSGASSGTVYIALADQDDTWHRGKLERCLKVMLAAEHVSPGLPVLVHSDLRVVKADGSLIAESLMHYQGLDASATNFSAQLISNTVTGCTTLMNPALLRKALPVPVEAVMHDWWLSLVANAFGRLVFVPHSLIDYRQHGRNTLGAREYKRASFDWQTVLKLFQLNKSPAAQQLFEDAAAQAEAFQRRYEQELFDEDRLIISDVIRMPRIGLWRQRFLFRKLRAAR